MKSRGWMSVVESTLDLEAVASAMALSLVGWMCRLEFTIDRAWALLAALPPQVHIYFTVQDRRVRSQPSLTCFFATETLVFAAAGAAALAPSVRSHGVG